MTDKLISEEESIREFNLYADKDYCFSPHEEAVKKERERKEPQKR